jgi:DNA-binding response OmpR family regulator
VNDRANARRVLLVEDEPDIAMTLSKRLRSRGFETAVAGTAAEALAAIARAAPDLVLLDLLLPGASGIDVLVEMKRRGDLDRVPVIVLTALPVRDAREALRQGARCVLQKPVDPSVLERAIEQAFGSQTA